MVDMNEKIVWAAFDQIFLAIHALDVGDPEAQTHALLANSLTALSSPAPVDSRQGQRRFNNIDRNIIFDRWVSDLQTLGGVVPVEDEEPTHPPIGEPLPYPLSGVNVLG